METKKIVMGVISVAVAIIVLMSMIPIFTDAGASEDTFTNEGMWRMAPNTNGDTYTFDSTTREWSLNGTVVNNQNSNSLSVILLDNTTVRSNGWIRGAQLTGNSVTTIVTNANDQTIVSGNGLQGNGTFDIQGYGINPNGDYLLTDYNKPAYMNGESTIYATGVTGIPNANGLYSAVIHIEGNIKDGVTITPYVLYNSPYTVTDVSITDIVIDYESVNGYKDLYKLNGITFNYSAVATNNSTSEVTTITDVACSYSSYVVPYEVTAERSVHASPIEATLIGLIPLLMMVGIMLTAVGLFIAKYRKN